MKILVVILFVLLVLAVFTEGFPMLQAFSIFGGFSNGMDLIKELGSGLSSVYDFIVTECPLLFTFACIPLSFWLFYVIISGIFGGKR